MGYETELTELIGPSGKSFRVYEDTSGNIRVKVNGTYVTSGNEVVTATTVNGDTQLLVGTAVFTLSEVSAYVTRTTTGTAFTGACEYAGYVCTVAAGNITIYDNTSAAGTVIVPTTALTVGAFPIFGAGTNGKMALTTGCHVVLSGAATVNVLVQ